MTAHDLDDVLRRAGEQVEVTWPPVADMLQQDRHDRRRRRQRAGAAAVAAVVALGSGGLWALGSGAGGDGVIAAPGNGQVWVGHGAAAVRVPEAWRDGAVGCSAPLGDGAVDVVGPGRATPACASAAEWRSGQTLVTLSQVADDPSVVPWAADEPVVTTRRVAGIEVQVSEVSCADVPSAGGDVELCSGQAWVPDEEAMFSVRSTSGVEAVEEVLATVRVLPGTVGVPEYRGFVARDGLTSGEVYVQALRDLGLEPRVTFGAADEAIGTVLSVEPVAGTVLERGSVVEVVLGEAAVKSEARAEAQRTMHTVGLGSVGVDVPESWPRGAVECGVPTEDTWTVEGSSDARRACRGFWRPDLTWVQVRALDAASTGATPGAGTVECEPTDRPGGSPLELCTGSVRFAAERVEVKVSSTAGRDAVTRRLETVHQVPGKVGVPNEASFVNEYQERSGEKYVQRLEELGLTVWVTRTPHDGRGAGVVVEAFPGAGELVDVGGRVDVVISSGKR